VSPKSDASIRRILLGTSFTARVPDESKRVSALFHDQVFPTLTSLGIDATLIEVLTPSRSISCKRVDGRHYILFDHGALRCLHGLDRLLGVQAEAQVVASALQQILAEAARAGHHTDFYSFFIRRALEAGPVVPIPSEREWEAVAPTAQTLLILLHEVAHATPAGHPLHDVAEEYAALKISSVSTQWIRMISAKFSEALGLDLPSLTEDQLAGWIRFRDGLEMDDEQLGDAVGSVAGDAKFLAEIACDRVALILQQSILEGHREAHSQESFLGLAEDVLTAMYRAFLHLRLLKYIDDVFLHLPAHVLSEKINPLDLHSMVATGFRGTLVGQLVLDAAVEIGGDEYAQKLSAKMADIQERHRVILFEPLNRLLEMTVLNAQFHVELPGLLMEDGVLGVNAGGDELDSLHESDLLWQRLAVAANIPVLGYNDPD
jgi:hypothetical protein